MRIRLAAAALALVLLCLPGKAQPADPSVAAEAQAFMDAYTASNWDAVKSHLSFEHVFVYGSDLSEFADTMEAFKAMFDADQKLWRGAASFGSISQISQYGDAHFASLFFTREFKIGSRVLNVRFATVWHKEHGHWKLVQSSNVVPTVGQSAAEILKQQTGQ